MSKLKLMMASAAIMTTGMLPALAQAASSYSTNFESLAVGDINGQDGWTKTGPFDAAVSTNTSGASSFGTKSLRISDAVTSGSFGDQVFAKPLADSVGEADATAASFSAGTKQSHFEMKFDFASATPSVAQLGMHTSISPDRGDGSRMSYLRIDEGATGFDVYFDDVSGTTSPVTFNESLIAGGLSRTAAHNVKLSFDAVDGPSNDVVKVWVDGSLKVTGTSWENYYRYDAESSAEQSPRIVKTVLFRESGDAHPANDGNGFLFDNLSLSSNNQVSTPPVARNDCKNDGWSNFTNPAFKNQGVCMAYVNKHNHRVDGNIKYSAGNLQRSADFSMDTAGNRGTFEYSDANHDWYKVAVSAVKVDGANAYFAGKVTHASNPSWVGNWLFVKVQDGHPDKVWGSFTTEAAAKAGVASGSSPADGPFDVTKGNLRVR